MTTPSTKIESTAATKVFPGPQGAVVAFQNLDLTVADGEFVAVVGPSGCGKSTFLRVLAGLISLTSGQVTIARGANDRPLANMVFQDYALFPWKTVQDNVAFGLEMRGIGQKQRHAIAQEWLRKVGLSRFARAYPRELSGGMKQRVSIVRAFANDPEILLMDEPLAALDAQTRHILQEELIRLWEASVKTVVYITHSIDEAVLLADRVILMTAHPGTKKGEYQVPFSRPRNLALTGTAEFGQLTYTIWQDLQDEVQRAMEQQR